MTKKRGFIGRIYGFQTIWEVNALTGKVNMTPDEVMESVKLIILSKQIEVLEKMKNRFFGIAFMDNPNDRINEMVDKELTKLREEL